MEDFFAALHSFPFLRNAFVAGALAAVAGGLVGAFVHLRRIAFAAGGVSHAALGGVGLFVFLGLTPFYGALASALLFTLVLTLLRRHRPQHEDTMIGALWALGMSIGILFLHLTPGHRADLMAYLFGSILLVPRGTILRLLVIDGVIILLVLLFFRQLVAVSFDDEYARTRGLRGTALYALLLGIVALTVVVLMQAVGLVLVIALLTLPAAAASLTCRSPATLILTATAIAFGAVFAGIYGSFALDLPAGPAIILVAALIYGVMLVVGRRSGVGR